MQKAILCLGALLAFGLPHLADASCGSASCPLNNHHYLRAGSLMVMYSHEYINQDRILAGSSLSFVGAIPELHNEVQTINMRNTIEFQLGVTDRLGLGISLPFITREHSHIHVDPTGDEWEQWSFSGLGDLIVKGQYAVVLPSGDFDPYLSVTGGVKLANGVTHLRNANGEEAEVTIQPGSGSVDGMVGLYYRQALGTVRTLSGEYSAIPLTVGLSYQIAGAGTYGYKFGNTLLAHAATSYQISARAELLLQINGRFQGMADVGSTGEPRGNTGGTWIYASPGFSINVIQGLSAYGYVQVPIYQNVNGLQQTSRYNLQFGLAADVSLLD